MVTLGALNPQHVIKQQLITITGCQPVMRLARGTDHDFMQFPYF
jgi:hypothetical protein